MTTFNAIILDMDGTLVNTERLWRQAEGELLSAHGRQYDTNIHSQFLGMAVQEFMPAVQKAYDLFHIDIKDLEVELEARAQKILEAETQPTEGAIELVQYITSNNIPCAIASNSSHQMIETTLCNQRWLDVIPKRYSSDDVPNAKPAPDLYLYVAEQLGADPKTCIAVEDSLTGVRSAVSADMTCLAVPEHDVSNIEAYHRITPHVFASLIDVLDYIQSHNMK